jgi:ubiquinone biosynthesis protein
MGMARTTRGATPRSCRKIWNGWVRLSSNWDSSWILDAVGNAELNVNVKPSETEFLVESAQKVANRITSGLILAALLVGAALLMRVQTQFELFGYPGLAIICFLAAAAGGCWLLLNIFWQDHKSKQKSMG